MAGVMYSVVVDHLQQGEPRYQDEELVRVIQNNLRDREHKFVSGVDSDMTEPIRFFIVDEQTLPPSPGDKLVRTVKFVTKDDTPLTFSDAEFLMVDAVPHPNNLVLMRSIVSKSEDEIEEIKRRNPRTVYSPR